jgi:hypothetical protein
MRDIFRSTRGSLLLALKLFSSVTSVFRSSSPPLLVAPFAIIVTSLSLRDDVE